MNDQEIVDDLEGVWQSIVQICSSLSDQEWDTATDCPGWTVKDLLSHMVGTESRLLGRPQPEHTPPLAGRLPNKIAEFNEVCVDYRRPWPGSMVLDEFRAVSAARLAVLRSMNAEDFARETRTPLGLAPYRDFLRIRIFDCWVHEQDMRRALGRPGGLEGRLAEQALERLIAAMPYVVGKKVGAPKGTTVVVAITGPVGATLPIAMEEKRARPLADPPISPTTALSMDFETFMCLSCGRWEPDATLKAGRVRIEGDKSLGRRVVEQLNVMM